MGSSNSKSNSFNSTSTIKHVHQTSPRVRCNGGYWQSQVALDLNADKPFEACNLKRINDPSLISLMQQLIDTSENIISVGVYKCPLKEGQLVQLLDCHQFVVLETPNWWYSIEKNDEFIYIQRAKELASVRCYLRNDRRYTPIKLISVDNGRETMMEFIKFLYKNDELNKRYDSVTSNCHAFAKRIFDKFAARKFHDIVWGCSPTLVITPPWQKRA